MTTDPSSDRADMERIEQLPRPDWTDQDLLTKDEARDRLVDEIARARDRLQYLEANPDRSEAEIALLARRLNAMESVRDEYNDYLDDK